MKELIGKNAIVTGASYGTGPETALVLAQQGVKVALVARSAGKLRQVASRLEAAGHCAMAIPTDITDPLGREALVTRAEAALGPIDILVNNAGIHNGGRLHMRSQEELDAVIQTNLTAVIMLTRRLLPGMLERHEGHVVHVASLAGKAGIPYIAAYAASKYGVVGFNHSLQGELRGTGVGSSAVIQGFTREKGMWARLQRKVHPAFGLSSPGDVARAVVRAIRGNRVEVIVNPLPVRPVLMLWAVAPGMAAKMFGLLHVNQFMEDTALQMEADAVMEDLAGVPQ